MVETQAERRRPVDVAEIQRTLRAFIAAEWSTRGCFPCYVNFDMRGDPEFHAADVVRYLASPIRPSLRILLAACAPFMAVRAVFPRRDEGFELDVTTKGWGAFPFHPFFTDYYLHRTILQMVRAPDLPDTERAQWVEILIRMVESAVTHDIRLRVGADEYRIFKFFHTDDPSRTIGSNGFLSASGLINMEPDSDTTCILFEMYAHTLDVLGDAARLGVAEERIQALRSRIEDLLAQPIWRLLRSYQFRPDGQAAEPVVNYTDIDSSGGVTMFFTSTPQDAPDIATNANVLRTLFVNARRWRLAAEPEGVRLVHGIVDFVYRNVASGLFRRWRGHSFYSPPVFAAKFGWMWRAFQALDETERRAFDPEAKLAAARTEILRYLGEDMDPARAKLNPLDAALALGAAADLGGADPALLDRWVGLLGARLAGTSPPYRAYEIFRGKLPMLTVYGSEVITAAMAHLALVSYARYAAGGDGGDHDRRGHAASELSDGPANGTSDQNC